MRLLDIIIPEYNCKNEFMVRLLNSINTQKGIDFTKIGIIIVNDNSKDKYKKSWFKQRFPKLQIEYYLKDVNEGQGLTRQYGLEKSVAKYVTFVDQDDEIYGKSSLKMVLDLFSERKAPFAISSIIEEVKDENNNTVCKERSCYNFKSLHGLYIEREYLQKNNIRFHEDLRHFEDIYFCNCLFYTAPVFDYYNFVTYLWKYNDVSQVRTKSKYNFEVREFKYFYLCTKYSIEFLESKKSEVLPEFTYVSLYSLLLTLKSEYFNFSELNDVKNEYLSRLKELYNRYYKYTNVIPDDVKIKYRENEIGVLLRSMPKLQHVDIDDFLNEI